MSNEKRYLIVKFEFPDIDEGKLIAIFITAIATVLVVITLTVAIYHYSINKTAMEKGYVERVIKTRNSTYTVWQKEGNISDTIESPKEIE